MAEAVCECGAHAPAPEVEGVRIAQCNTCGRALRYVGAEHASHQIDAMLACLHIKDGPGRVGEQIFLCGKQPITVGKLAEQAICLASRLVSRRHCEFKRNSAGEWTVVDTGSTNGVRINGANVEIKTLSDGDTVIVGDFTLHFRARKELPMSEHHHTHKMPHPAPAAHAPATPLELDEEDKRYLMKARMRQHHKTHQFHAPAPWATEPTLVCPRCKKTYLDGVKSCVDCGKHLEAIKPSHPNDSVGGITHLDFRWHPKPEDSGNASSRH
jgi:pSer/pThr/pTyr-binding forkhead associated (FHA) protein